MNAKNIPEDEEIRYQEKGGSSLPEVTSSGLLVHHISQPISPTTMKLMATHH